MSKNRIKELMEQDDRIADRIYELQLANKYDSDEYKELKRSQELINNEMNEYLRSIIDENVDKNIRTCIEMLSKMEEFTIGSHMCGLNNRIMCEPSMLAKSILEKGLISARREGGGVAENVHILGDDNIIDNLRSMLEKFYSFALYRNTGGAVVAIPTTMLSENGERVEIGTFPKNLDFISKDDRRVANLPINIFVNNIGYLPPEFILGVVSKNESDDVTFTKNNRFITELSEDEQIELYNKFVSMGLKVTSRKK